MEISTMLRISRRAFAAAIAVSALIPGGASAADAPKEIHLDWATYNPVSMILKQKGLLEKEFAKDGIRIVWVQSAGSNKAPAQILAAIVIFAILGKTTDWLIEFACAPLLRWQDAFGRQGGAA
jgi:ABC-type nitrate/sulfonate/bicarbonate transport system substrate-binding protein